MLIYYAHSQTTYHTDQEREDILALERLGFEVYNPNNVADEHQFRREGMAHFDALLDEYNFAAIFYRTYRDGVTSYGTGYEVALAQNYGIPTFEITETVRAYSSSETRAIYTTEGRDDLAVLYTEEL
jgi:hypothetical protein